MTASELRIGNYLQGKNLCEVTEILHSGAVKIKDNPSRFYVVGEIPCLDPIPLTEEWLKKFGFVNRYTDSEDNSIYERKGIDIKKAGYYYYSTYHKTDYLVNVHQLQNLYFALTNTELTAI